MTRLMKRLPPLLFQTMLSIHEDILKGSSRFRTQSYSFVVQELRRSCLELATVVSIVVLCGVCRA